MLGKEKVVTTEGDEMVGWHHWLNGHEFEQGPEVGDGQGGLACCSPWGCKELDTTEWLNWLPDWCHMCMYLQALCVFPSVFSFWILYHDLRFMVVHVAIFKYFYVYMYSTVQLYQLLIFSIMDRHLDYYCFILFAIAEMSLLNMYPVVRGWVFPGYTPRSEGVRS